MKSVPNNIQVQKLINGDSQTLEDLYKVLFNKVFSYVRKNSGNYADAEEVFQNALFQLIVRAKTRPIEIKSSLEGYIFVICKNLWLKELNIRKKVVRKDGFFELKIDTSKSIASILEQERWELFESKLELLSDNCKHLLKDFFNKVPYSEVVKKFKYSNENVAFQRMFKCKKKLASLIKSDVNYKKLLT